MSGRILVAYATKHGSTAEVASAIAHSLERCGVEVELRPAAEVRDLAPYDGVVLGGALYMGRVHRDATAFLRRHEEALAAKRLAIFGMGPTDMSDAAGSRRQLERSIARVHGVEPEVVAVFGGAVDPTKLRFPFNRMPAADARDWPAIEAWTAELAGVFGLRETRTDVQHAPR